MNSEIKLHAKAVTANIMEMITAMIDLGTNQTSLRYREAIGELTDSLSQFGDLIYELGRKSATTTASSDGQEGEKQTEGPTKETGPSRGGEVGWGNGFYLPRDDNNPTA